MSPSHPFRRSQKEYLIIAAWWKTAPQTWVDAQPAHRDGTLHPIGPQIPAPHYLMCTRLHVKEVNVCPLSIDAKVGQKHRVRGSDILEGVPWWLDIMECDWGRANDC